MSSLHSLPPTFATTVAALHRVAQQTVAPARKPDNEIALQVTPGGFGTPVFDWDGERRQVRVEGAELVWIADDDERREALPGVDAVAAARLADWYALGDEVLRRMNGVPVVWPEHFDIAIELGEATYGFSPGDDHHTEPYAYVAPWNKVQGELWQATGFRGAELTYGELRAAPDASAAAVEFFTIRKEALA